MNIVYERAEIPTSFAAQLMRYRQCSKIIEYGMQQPLQLLIVPVDSLLGS